MAQSQIFNLTRSGLYWELLEAHVDVATCNEQFLSKCNKKMNVPEETNQLHFYRQCS